MESSILEKISPLSSFFKKGTTRSIHYRQQQLRILQHAIYDSQHSLIDALYNDLAKPTFEAHLSEIQIILQEIDHALDELHTWARPKKTPTPFIHFPASSRIIPEPRGIVLIIGPWNYPLQLILIPLIGAIAAGNCAILKPSEHAPHCSKAIADLIASLFPPDYITVIQGDKKVAQELLTHKVDYIFFTGTAHVGKLVMAAAAKQLTPITLELGGKSPCIVTESANLDCAAKRIVWGKFFNAGQNCISPDYLLVQTQIKDRLIEKIIEWIKKMYGEDPSKSPDYARIINNAHMDRLKNLLKQGVIIFGGTIDTETGYIAPTLIDQVDLQAPIMQEEIFGPLLPIISYKTVDEVVQFINARPKSLALYLFSASKKDHASILNQTQSGGVCINDTLLHAASPYLPFGGVGQSGFGAYHGKYSFDIFTHYKSVVYNSCHFDHGLRYPPYNKKHEWLKRLLSYWKLLTT